MNKLAISLAITSVLTLSACDDTTLKDVQEKNEPVVPAARIVFDPSNGALSVPNDLLFLGTVDGTLNIPVTDPSDFNDPQNALNALDGWSTENAFVIGINFPQNVSLDKQSASMPGAVRLFEAVMGGQDADCAEVPLGAACKVVGELTFGVDFVTVASGNDVAVVPLKPLKSGKTYLGVTTNILQDSMGRSILDSSTYSLVRQDINELPLSSPSQLALQGVINSYNNALEQQAGVDLDSVSFSFAMTTESTGVVLGTVKQLLVADPTRMPQGGVQDTTCSVLDLLSAGNAGKPYCNLLGLDAPLVDPTDPSNMIFAAAKFYGGQVGLPHFLDRVDPLNGRWMANCDSGATLKGYLDAGGQLPAEPVSENDALCRQFGLADIGIDTERHLTKYNPIPKLTGDAELGGAVMVPSQLTVPDINVANAIRQNLGLPALVQPEAGWPVTILYHGITSRKEDMLAMTGAMSIMGLATIAIDHPLHGQRGYDLNGDGTDDVNASTGSATDYMALGSLLTTRDNLRQSIADMLSLRLSLHNTVDINTGMQAPIDPMKVSFVGHSLGAITGTSFLALTNTPLGIPAVDAMYHVDASALANPGGGIANFLIESPAFGPLIEATLVISSDTDFQQYYGQNGTVAPGAPGFDAELLRVYGEWIAMQDNAKLAEIAATKAQFVFAAQTVTEAGDPNNYAAMLQANGTPVLAYAMVGDGMANLPDLVIPNTTTSPIGGTEPLFALLGLEPVTGNVAGEEPSSGAVRFLFGTHSSLLDPSSAPYAPDNTAAVTAEMQQQIATYLVNGGKAIFVSDSSLILGGE